MNIVFFLFGLPTGYRYSTAVARCKPRVGLSDDIGAHFYGNALLNCWLLNLYAGFVKAAGCKRLRAVLQQPLK